MQRIFHNSIFFNSFYKKNKKFLFVEAENKFLKLNYADLMSEF